MAPPPAEGERRGFSGYASRVGTPPAGVSGPSVWPRSPVPEMEERLSLGERFGAWDRPTLLTTSGVRSFLLPRPIQVSHVRHFASPLPEGARRRTDRRRR